MSGFRRHFWKISEKGPGRGAPCMIVQKFGGGTESQPYDPKLLVRIQRTNQKQAKQSQATTIEVDPSVGQAENRGKAERRKKNLFFWPLLTYYIRSTNAPSTPIKPIINSFEQHIYHNASLSTTRSPSSQQPTFFSRNGLVVTNIHFKPPWAGFTCQLLSSIIIAGKREPQRILHCRVGGRGRRRPSIRSSQGQ